MNSLKNQLKNQIPILQNDIKKKLISDKGDQKISEVTVAQAYSGLRALRHLFVILHLFLQKRSHYPRNSTFRNDRCFAGGSFYLLLTGDLPNESELNELQRIFKTSLQFQNTFGIFLMKCQKKHIQ